MPLTIFWGFLLLSGLFSLLKRKKCAGWFLAAAIVWMALISTRPLTGFLVSRLENRYPPLLYVDTASLEKPVRIMVLGSGFSDDSRLSPNSRLSVMAMGRVAEGIRMHKLVPESTIVFSGYKGKLSISQAEVSADAAVSLGVGRSSTAALTTTRTTLDEAETFFSTFGPGGTLILVTDAIHMPRAMKLFKASGLDPIASPTNYIIKRNSVRKPELPLPAAGYIRNMENAVHEMAGMVWYWAGGR